LCSRSNPYSLSCHGGALVDTLFHDDMGGQTVWQADDVSQVRVRRHSAR